MISDTEGRKDFTASNFEKLVRQNFHLGAEEKNSQSQTQIDDRTLRAIFELIPGCYLILRPDLTIVTASNAYLDVTMTTHERIAGKHLFEAFPDNPDDPTANGNANFAASFKTILNTKLPHTMALQKYDIRQPNGKFEERWWSPVNSPILDQNQNIIYLFRSSSRRRYRIC